MKKALPLVVAAVVVVGIVVAARLVKHGAEPPNGGEAVANQGDPDSGDDANGGGPVIIGAQDAAEIVIEAESFKFDGPWKVKACAECSGGKCAWVPEKANKEELNPEWKTLDGKPIPWQEVKNHPREKRVHNGVGEAAFDVETGGEYVVWMRVKWLHGCANSVGFSIDGGEEIGVGDHNYKPAPRWHWNACQSAGEPRRFKLAAGPHTMKLFNREDGGEIDQILLTTDEVVPQGIN